MAYIKNPTEAQKQDWKMQIKQQEEEMQRMIKNLAQSYQEKPETIAEFLSFGSSFYKYSIRNNMLIYGQNPHSTYVQSFKAWKDLGYPPKKGERGMKVYVPVQATILKVGDKLVPLEQATKEQKLQYQAGELESTSQTRFKLGTVFDIAQTVFPKEKYPQLFHMGYPSELHKDVIKGLIDFGEQSLNYTIKTKDMKSISLRGKHIGQLQEIHLNEQLNDTQRLSTLAHELGHAVLHQIPSDIGTAQKELEADALGIMIEGYFGIKPTDSRKRHLADNFREYEKAYKKDPNMDSFGEILKNVFTVFKKHEPDIAQAVENHIPLTKWKKNLEPVQKPKQKQLTGKKIYEEIKRQVTIEDYALRHGFTVYRIGKYYSLKEADSVMIDREKNCFWRNSAISPITHKGLDANVSGSVIDFAAHFVHNGSLHEALKELQGMIDTTVYTRPAAQTSFEKKTVEKGNLQDNLPPKAKNMHRVYAYLTKSRYIDQDVVQDFVNQKMLYQDEKGNCVFVAYGEDQKPNFAALRGTLTDKKFIGDVSGSDYKKGYYIDNGKEKLIVSESVIDAMSIMTILKGQGVDYKEYDYLVSAGTGKWEVVLDHLAETPKKEVLLSMDHDLAGVKTMGILEEEILNQFQDTVVSFHVPGIEHKDWNGELAYAAKQFKAMDTVPYLENSPLPEIKYCAVQSTEQIEERGFRIRNGKHQYRLVEIRDGAIQPMEINRNIIYNDPRELKKLVPPMYLQISYKELEKLEALEKNIVPHTIDEELKEKSATSEQMKSEGTSQMNVDAQPSSTNIEIKEIYTTGGIYTTRAIVNGEEKEVAIQKRGHQFYIETGYAFDDTLEEHILNDQQVRQVQEHLPQGYLENRADGIMVMDIGTQGLTNDELAKIEFLKQLQAQTLKKSASIAKQPAVSIEIEL